MITHISIIMPCCNEEATVGNCVREAFSACEVLGIEAEVIVVDNGSQDQSAAMALEAGARLLHESRPEYGMALRKGMEAAQYDYIITGDSDGQHLYSQDNIKRIMEALERGAHFVNGSRFRSGNPNYPMSLGKHSGNIFLRIIFNRLFKTTLTDVTCGMNGYNKKFLHLMALESKGMELNVEIRARSILAKAAVSEVEIWCLNRINGKSHVRFWRDGWQHLLTMARLRYGRYLS